MIVPRQRVLYWAMALVPVAAVGGMIPAAGGLAVACAVVLAAVAVGDALLARRRVRGLSVSLPEVVRLALDRPGHIPVILRRAQTTKMTVTVGLPLPAGVGTSDETLDLALADGVGDVKTEWPCTPVTRGRFEIDRCYVEAPSPLGFWGVRTALPCRAEIRVYPNLMRERRHLAALFLRRGRLGLHAQRVVGHGREFEKLREYVPGDSYEDIHWKATARRGKPITRLFQVERTREIYVALDSSRLSARDSGNEPALDRFIRAALVLGLAVEQQGDLFGVMTFSDRIRRFIRAGRGRTHYNVCRDALYSVESEIATPDFDELCSFSRLTLRKRSLLLVLTDLSDPVLAETFRRSVELICRQHLVMVLMIKPPGLEPLFSAPNAETADQVYRNLAGHLMWQDLREVGRELGRPGVQFSLAENEDLSARLVSRYMSVKTRQML